MKFAEFEADPASGELRRNGERVRIQDLPFRILIVLLSRAGEVVTRDQLRAELWGAETFVDAEAGLNTAIAKLREALGDSAESPKFIETLPKRGYRFIGPIHAPFKVETSETVVAYSTRTSRIPIGIVLALIAAVILFGGWRLWFAPCAVTIAVVLFHNETGDAANDSLAQQLTDGTVVALAASPRYSVIGNAAILRTPRIFADIQQIGAALKADYLVLGQVQRGESGLVIRTHFIRVSDQKHLWAKGIEGERPALDTVVPRTVASAVDIALAKPPQ